MLCRRPLAATRSRCAPDDDLLFAERTERAGRAHRFLLSVDSLTAAITFLIPLFRLTLGRGRRCLGGSSTSVSLPSETSRLRLTAVVFLVESSFLTVPFLVGSFWSSVTTALVRPPTVTNVIVAGLPSG